MGRVLRGARRDFGRVLGAIERTAKRLSRDGTLRLGDTWVEYLQGFSQHGSSLHGRGFLKELLGRVLAQCTRRPLIRP